MAIISSRYCTPYPMDLAIRRKTWTLSDDVFTVEDLTGRLLFKVKAGNWSGRRLIIDAAGNPVVTLRPKTWSSHNRWKVYRGNSKDPNHVLFSTVVKTGWFQRKTKLKVFLASNTTETVPDYTVKGDHKSCIIYAGDQSASITAQMHKQDTFKSIFLGKDNFMVTVYPNIDHAFIVALILILDKIINSG